MYKPDFHLTLAKDGVKEGDFVMAMGYPGRTNRHRLPSEVSETFEWAYPNTVAQFKNTLDIIGRETATDKDAELKYASRVAGLNNYMKNRQGMLDSFADSDFLARKTAEHAELTKWVNSSRDNKKAYAADLKNIEKLLKQRQDKDHKDYLLDNAKPRLLTAAGALYRLAEETTKPDAERKAGFQSRDLPRYKAFVAGMERNFAVSVEKALDLYNLGRYAAQPKKQRDAEFDKVMGIKDGMTEQQLSALIDSWYANTGLTTLDKRNALLEMTPEQIAASARDEDPDVIGLSILSGSHLALVPEVMLQLKKAGVTSPVVVGGIIPEDDRKKLTDLGVVAVYTPKDFDIARIMREIAEISVKHRQK